MSFKEDCQLAVRNIVRTDFNMRVGREVPTTEKVVQKDGAVAMHDVAYLYADMADSSGVAQYFLREDAAIIIRAYLHAVSRVLNDRGGAIRSFDGDRVMAIFTGDNAVNDAVDAALRINWVVKNIVHEELSNGNKAYLDRWVEDGWVVKHRTGIDVGSAFIVRAGVRGSNDLVSIGSTPNIAAKLSDYKGGGQTIITDRVWDALSYRNCYARNAESNSDEEVSMWTLPKTVELGGTFETIRTSTWWRRYQ